MGAIISAGNNDSAGLTLSGTEAQINAALATLTYQGNTGFTGSDTLTVLSTDSTDTPLTDTDAVSILVGLEAGTGVVWGIRNNNELGYLNPDNGYTWTARRTLTATTDAFALVDSETGIGARGNDEIVLIDLDSGEETVLTVTNPGSFSDLGTYEQGTYDAATNIFYTTEVSFREFQVFSVDLDAGTVTFVEEREVGTGGTNIQAASEDWVLINNKLYGVDNGTVDLEIIDLSAPANFNLTRLEIPEIDSTTGNDKVSGVWQGENGLIHVLDDSGTVFEIDPATNSFVQVLQTQTPNGDIWDRDTDDFAGLAPIPPAPADAVWGVRNQTELGYLDPNADYIWTAVSTLSENTDAFALIDSTNTKAIATRSNSLDVVLIDLPSGDRDRPYPDQSRCFSHPTSPQCGYLCR